MVVLGIETSCDETAAAVVEAPRSGPRILSNLVRSQLDDHAPYGGVVPEIAARAHLDHIEPAGAARARRRRHHIGGRVDGVAAAGGPGLIGGLIVGTMMAKGIAWAAGKPFLAVNHLEAHALSVRLDRSRRLSLSAAAGFRRPLPAAGLRRRRPFHPARHDP